MLEELLGELVSTDRVQSLLELAVLDRDFARQALDDRVAAIAPLAGQLAAGVWSSRDVAAAVESATSDRLLLRMSCQKYVEARGSQCDLDNEYHPLLPPGRALSLEDITTALAFIGAARPIDPPELWFAALQEEATAYLHQMRGDIYLAQAIASLDVLEAELMALLDPEDPYAARNIQVHAAAIALFHEQRVPWRVEAAYRRFLAGFSEDPFAGWHTRSDADPEYHEATSNAYYSLVLNTLDALCLRNPSDRSEIERLRAEQPPPDFAPALAMFEPDVVPLPPFPPAVFERAAGVLRDITAALKPDRSAGRPRRAARAVAVLRAWEAFARRGLNDFRGVAGLLSRARPDDEALGIVARALRGEAFYRMGRYEDAYLDLLDAEEAARAGLGRRDAARADGAGWSEAERDGVARLAQKAGNALAVIGDEERAAKVYARAAELAVGPLARAGSFVNEGNRHFLRNSIVGGQGYITLDAEARQRFVVRGPDSLRLSVIGQHVESLCKAEAAYWAALDIVAGLDPVSPGADTLSATCHIDLGNVGWAWGQTLVADGARLLADLPLGTDFASRLLAMDADAVRCYEAAVTQYQAALQRLAAPISLEATPSPRADARPLVLTALSSLSEMCYLIAREQHRTGNPPGQDATHLPPVTIPEPGSPAFVSLDMGVDVANRCLALIQEDDASLYPDLVWRTHYNLARMHRLLGDPAKAAAHFRDAIDTVEQLRHALRLDSLQAAFLHDKHDVYEGYIDLLLEQDPVNNLPQIFELFERSRARAYLALLRVTQRKSSLPKSLREKAEDLLARVSACNEEIQAAVAADCPEQTQALLAEQRRLALLWRDMQSRIARYEQGATAAASAVVSLAEFQGALGSDQAYLGLLLGDEASYALLVDRTSARAFRLPRRRTLELLALPVLTYATWSNAETASAFRSANVRLTSALFGPAETEIELKAWLSGKHLLISPDGILCYLPLDLLLADSPGLSQLPETADYPDFAPFYLLSLADISYVPSASAWLEMARRKREPSRAGMMAVYNVLYDTPEPPLWAVTQQVMLKLGAVTSGPDMKRLTEAVRKAWGDSVPIVRLRSRTDEGAAEEAANQSTERNFLRVAPDARARILMFHGHGIYNDRYPSLSGLIFNLRARGNQEGRAAIPTLEDGFLRVEELFQLDLPGVELTLLAACQTAQGAYRRGEGLNALVRGFLHRGSSAVMATLWEVRADMTAFLLRVFFRLLAEQPDADRARLFSQAKRKAMPYVANLYLPYFWAPFVLWGYTGPQPVQEGDHYEDPESYRDIVRRHRSLSEFED